VEAALVTRHRVYITDCDHGHIEPEIEVLSTIGVTPILRDCRSEEEVVAQCGDADALLIQRVKIGAKAFASLPRLKVICRYGVGYDNFDLSEATRAGVMAVNVPDYCIDEVSNHALAMLLARCRHIPDYNRAVHSGGWDHHTDPPLERLTGKTVGIVGFGRIGSEFGRKVKALGVEVIVCDPYVDELPPGFAKVGFQELLSQSDYISLHCPLNQETYHLVGERALALMKPTAVLINTARGPVVDQKALATALVERRLRAAALDVLETEPPDTAEELLGLNNVYLSPHAAYYSEESQVELKTRATQAVVATLRGEVPKDLLNPQVLSSPARRWREE
jgi:D-3-phosphoglycerate dehydrogenase